MVRNEFTFPSADGRTGIHAVEWTPDMAPRAVLVLSHGVSEHILRYEPLAAYLTEWGFAVAGHDHLGHGLSVAAGRPGCTSDPGAAGTGRCRTSMPGGSWQGSGSPAFRCSCWGIPWGPSWPGRI